MNKVPKVFVSHASDDKERFVLKFATKLREHGIDAWLDKWEMFPGDSLIDKIFEEGIKNANAILIILSNYSVVKPWVREELNASVVKKINEGSKLIPVVIDNCNIPESLKSTLWVKINNLNEYDTELERIIMSIFGVNDKPPIGESPAFTRIDEKLITGLNKIDSIIFKSCCEEIITNSNNLLGFGQVLQKLGEYEISEAQLLESLEILNHESYIDLMNLRPQYGYFKITTFGLNEYLQSSYHGFEELINTLCYEIVNQNLKDNIKITEEMKIPKIISNHIFDILESRGLIKTQSLGVGGMGFRMIYNISPKLKRLLEK